MNKTRVQRSDYERMGIAALIPGLQRAIEVMTRQVETYRAILNHTNSVEAEHDSEPESQPAAKRKNQASKSNVRNYWAAMTKDERRVEMARRLRVREGKAKSTNPKALAFHRRKAKKQQEADK